MYYSDMFCAAPTPGQLRSPAQDASSTSVTLPQISQRHHLAVQTAGRRSPQPSHCALAPICLSRESYLGLKHQPPRTSPVAMAQAGIVGGSRCDGCAAHAAAGHIAPHPPCRAMHRVLLHGLTTASLNGTVGTVQGSLDEGRHRVLIFSA